MDRDMVAELNDEMLFCDGFDEALIGFVEIFGRPPLALYDKDKMIQIMMERDGMTEEEAIEYYEYNILGAWMGENTPAYATFIEE